MVQIYWIHIPNTIIIIRCILVIKKMIASETLNYTKLCVRNCNKKHPKPTSSYVFVDYIINLSKFELLVVDWEFILSPKALEIRMLIHRKMAVWNNWTRHIKKRHISQQFFLSYATRRKYVYHKNMIYLASSAKYRKIY